MNLGKSLKHAALLLFATFAFAQTAPWTPPYDFNRDVEYAAPDGTPLLMDIVVPAGKGPFPTIVCFPGNAWGYYKNDKSQFGYILQEAAKRGFAAASVNIRAVGRARKREDLAGPFPVPLLDAKAAARFLRDHAAEYHLDPARFGAAGWSSGATVALLLAMTGPGDGFEPPGTEPVRFKAVASNAGTTDMVSEHAFQISIGDIYDGTTDMTILSLMIGGTPQSDPKVWASASAITYARKNAPAVLLLHGENDKGTSPDNARKLDAALKVAGADSTLVMVPAVNHVLHLSNRDEVWRFFDEKLKK